MHAKKLEKKISGCKKMKLIWQVAEACPELQSALLSDQLRHPTYVHINYTPINFRQGKFNCKFLMNPWQYGMEFVTMTPITTTMLLILKMKIKFAVMATNYVVAAFM